MITIANIRFVLFATVIGAAIWFYKDAVHNKEEKQRLEVNAHQQRVSDSTRIAEITLNKSEMQEYLQYKNPELYDLLQKNHIQTERVNSILSTVLKYQDNKVQSHDLGKILEAVNKKVPESQNIVDSTGCMVIKGIVSFRNDSLKLDITDRKFKNKSDGICYWQRRQWKLLGIKTRIFGKKEFTAKVFDQCGESQTLRIEKKE